MKINKYEKTINIIVNKLKSRIESTRNITARELKTYAQTLTKIYDQEKKLGITTQTKRNFIESELRKQVSRDYEKGIVSRGYIKQKDGNNILVTIKEEKVGSKRIKVAYKRKFTDYAYGDDPQTMERIEDYEPELGFQEF